MIDFDATRPRTNNKAQEMDKETDTMCGNLNLRQDVERRPEEQSTNRLIPICPRCPDDGICSFRSIQRVDHIGAFEASPWQ